MKRTTYFYLNLPEGHDPVSKEPINANMRTLDELLGNPVTGINGRAKIAFGTYTGATPCAAPATYTSDDGKTFRCNFGTPVSSTSNKVITLDFEPLVLLISGSRFADISWSGRLKDSSDKFYDAAISGLEYQSFQQTILCGSSFSECVLKIKAPALNTKYGVGSETFDWDLASESGSKLNMSERHADGQSGAKFISRIMNSYTPGHNSTAAKYSVIIEGDNDAEGFRNYADIQGMSYSWVAIG